MSNVTTNLLFEADGTTLKGYQSTRTEGDLRIVTEYDATGAKVDEVITKTLVTQKLTDLSAEFQAAWGQVLAPLGASFAGDLDFQLDGDQVTVSQSGTVIGYVTSWNTQTSWDDVRMDAGSNPTQVELSEETKGYQVFDANWHELASTGTTDRKIISVDGSALASAILDEQATFTNYSIEKANYSGDWDALDPGVSAGLNWSDVGLVNINDYSVTTVVSGNAYRTGETAETEARGEVQFLDASGLFLGTSETRGGVTEVRDANFNVVGRTANLASSKTFAEMGSDLGSNWAAAWSAVSDYLPTDLKPSGDYTQLKFTYDQWDNILVFNPSGEMLGRIWAWSDENSEMRDWRGDYQINTHQSFTFNDLDGQNIARFEFNDRYGSSDGFSRDGNLEGTDTSVSYGIAKFLYDDSGAIVGTNPAVDWSLIEAEYDVPAAYQSALFGEGKSFGDRVDFITLGTATSTHYSYDDMGILIDTQVEDSTRIEFFDVRESDGGWQQFLGVMEVRDGYVEVRDSQWNQLAKIVDQSSALSFADVAADFAGFASAWATLEAYLPAAMAVAEYTDTTKSDVKTLANALKFTVDDNQIYVFDGTGAMLAHVNYWANSDDNEWIDWNNGNGQQITLSGSHYHYNFHDENWNSYGHAGGNLTYVTKVNGTSITPVLHEVGSNYGYRVSKDEYIAANDQAAWDALDPKVTQIDWSTVTEVELNNNSWASVDNAYREGDPWSNENESVSFFNSDGRYVGNMEMRDGFIEVRDGQWNLLTRKADLSDANAVKSFADLSTKFGSDWDTAWAKAAQYLPDAFKPGGDPTQLKFTLGEWNDVMVFDASGTMIGRIGTHENTNSEARSWRGDYQMWSHKSFNFHDADGNDIARYEVNGNWASSDGTTKGNQESGGETLSVRVSKYADDGVTLNSNWGSYATDYGDSAKQIISAWNADPLAINPLAVDFDEIDTLSIGTNTWTHYHYDDGGALTGSDTEVSERVEFFDNPQGQHYEMFLGVMEVRDGYVELRDSQWNQLAKIVDQSSALSFADVAADFAGFASAWATLEAYLPSAMAVAEYTDTTKSEVKTLANALKFTVDDNQIYVFDGTGAMLAQVGYWANSDNNEWTDYNHETQQEITLSGSHYHYNFNDEYWNSYGHAGGNLTYVTKVNGSPITKVLHEVGSNYGYRVSKDEYIAANDQAAWDALDPKVTQIDWSTVTEVELNNNSWASVDNAYRWGDPWSNENESVSFFNDAGRYVGNMEMRDGFIEVRDGQWNLLTRKADLSDANAVKSFADLSTKFGSDWDTAWAKAAQYLPDAFKPGGDYTQLKFTLGEWNDVMVFDASGTMIGRIGTHENTFSDPRGGDYRINTHKSFNFNDADWNDIARYEVNGNWASSDGTTKGNQEHSAETLSVRVSKYADDGVTLNSNWASYSVDPVSQGDTLNYAKMALPLITDWSTVDELSIGTTTRTHYNYDSQGNATTNIELAERIELFDIPEGAHYEIFKGVIEITDGFIEVLDENWNTISTSVDVAKAKDFAAIAQEYEGLAEAIYEVQNYLPSEMAVATTDTAGTKAATLVNNLKFTSDEWNIYVADASGGMVAIINNWSNDEEWYELGKRYTESEFNFQFQTPNRMQIAEYGKRVSETGPDDDLQPDTSQSWIANTVTAATIAGGQTEWDKLYNYFADMSTGVTSPVTWSDVKSVSLRTNTNYDETGSPTNSSTFYEFMDATGYRVAMVEDNGGIVTVYDGSWTMIDSYISSTASGIPFMDGVVATEAPEFLAAFGAEMRAAFPDIDSYEFVDAGNGPAFMLYNGEIEGFIYANDWKNAQGEEWFEFFMQDEAGRDIFRAGGFMDPNGTKDENGNPKILNKNGSDNPLDWDYFTEPSGLYLSSYDHKSLMTVSEWDAIEANYNAVMAGTGFDWTKVVAIENRVAQNDWSVNNTFDPQRTETHKFIIADQYGQLDHDYFRIHETGGIQVVEAFNKASGSWNNVAQSVADGTNFTDLSSSSFQYAPAIKFILDQVEVNAPGQFKSYMGVDLSNATVKLNALTNTLTIENGSALVATGSIQVRDQQRHDGSYETVIDVPLRFADGSEPVVFGGALTTDAAGATPHTDKTHSVWVGQDYTLENYDETTPVKLSQILSDHVSPNMSGINPADIGIIHVVEQFNADAGKSSYAASDYDSYVRTQYVPFADVGMGREYLWDYDTNYHRRVEDGVETIKYGDQLLFRGVADASQLVQITSATELAAFSSDLVDTLSRLDIDLLSNFDVYNTAGSVDLYLSKPGSTDLIFHLDEYSQDDPSSIQMGYNFISLLDGEYLGWIELGTPGDNLPAVIDPSEPFVPGLVFYGSQFYGMAASDFSVQDLQLIKDMGLPAGARYSSEDIDTFGVGERGFIDTLGLIGSPGDTILKALTIQHEMEGVDVADPNGQTGDDPWIGRLFFELQQGMKVSELYGGSMVMDTTVDPASVQALASSKASLYDATLSALGNYTGDALPPTEVPLANLSAYSSAAQDILDNTEYFKEIFGLMSVTDVGDREARLQLGSGNETAKILIDDVSNEWSYQNQDTVSGYELYEASTESDLGWLWESVNDTWGVKDSEGKDLQTKIYAFSIYDVLDALPAKYESNFEGLGVSDEGGSYAVGDIDRIDLRRDVHFEVDGSGDVVKDVSGKPVIVADHHMFLHFDQNDNYLGGVGLDVVSGTPFDFDNSVPLETSILKFDTALSGQAKQSQVEVFENIFSGIVTRLPEGLVTQDQLGGLCEIDPSSEYDELVGSGHNASVTGLNTFKSAGLDLDGMVPDGIVSTDTDYVDAQSQFIASLSSTWTTKLIDFETSNSGNFAKSSYSAASGDYHDGGSGDMTSGATGTLVIDNALSVTLFNTANEAGDGGNNGDDPGIATHTGNDADRGFNVTALGNQYLEVLAGETLSGGALFCFDDLNAPVYGVGFTLMGVEDTKRDVFIDVHLTDGSILRETADTHVLGMGGYQYYGYSLDATLAQSASIEGFVVYEPHNGEDASKRDIFGIDDVTLAYGSTFQTLCSIDPGTEYESFVGTGFTNTLPTYLSRFVSNRVELNGEQPATLASDPAATGVDLSSYHSTVSAFADAVALMSDHLGFVVHDFEASALGNFAVSGYTAATGDRVVDQSGTMMDPMNGANGTLVTDGVLSVSLFNTGQDVSVDDPGIASHAGNDADRGFNMTISGNQYLEILPSEKGPGGALFCFDEINVPVYGFGFNFIGAEEPKRDIYIDVHMSDGSIYRETAEAHALETGGQQYYSYLADPLLSGGASIEGFVLYEDHAVSDTGNDRDIFSVDDIALVVTDKVAQSLTPDQFANLAVNGPFSFEFVYSDQFKMALMDFAINPSPNLTMESTTDQLKLTSIGPSAADFVITIDAQNAFDVVSAGTSVTPEEFKDVLKLAVDPTHIVGSGVFKSTADLSDMVVSTSYHTSMTELIIKGYGDDGGILDGVQLSDLTAVEEKVGSYLVSSTDGWEVELNTTSLTDTNGNGLLDEAEAEVLGLFTTFDIDTLVAPVSVA